MGRAGPLLRRPRRGRSLLARALVGLGVLGAGPLAPAAHAAVRGWHHHHLAPVAVDDPSGLCEAAIARAEARYDTPPALLTAISLVETGRPDRGRTRAWPWAVDVDGTPFFFPREDAAIGFTRGVLLAGATSVDVGCMQVNLEQHPDAFAGLDAAFDPEHNVDYATRFLLFLHRGPARFAWPTAVGFYHSQTPALAAAYQARVLAVHALLAPGADALLPATGVNSVTMAAAHAPASAEELMRRAWAATLAENAAAEP